MGRPFRIFPDTPRNRNRVTTLSHLGSPVERRPHLWITTPRLWTTVSMAGVGLWTTAAGVPADGDTL